MAHIPAVGNLHTEKRFSRKILLDCTI